MGGRVGPPTGPESTVPSAARNRNNVAEARNLYGGAVLKARALAQLLLGVVPPAPDGAVVPDRQAVGRSGPDGYHPA